MVLDYFEDARSFPSPRFRAWVLTTKLRNYEVRYAKGKS
jgi:hypothetical protein